MITAFRFFSVLFTLLLCAISGAQEPGAYDSTFAASNLPDAGVSTLAASGQKILAGGDFTKFGEKRRPRIARLDANGLIDDSFDPREGFNSSVYTIAVQGDGKILAGGAFTSFDGNPITYLARLNDNGDFDSSFGIGSGPNSHIYKIVSLENGDLLIGGAFSAFNGSSSRQYLIRLRSNGAVDTAFSPQINGAVLAIAPLANGQILIGGDFTAVSGQPRYRIARLNGNGGLDSTFDPGAGAAGSIRTITLLADGKILVGGNFATMNGGAFPYLTRLLPSGLPDFEFQSSLNGQVYATVVQVDGRIAVAGDFSGNITRLRSNGSADSSFNPGRGANGSIYSLLSQASGDFVVGGAFTQIDGNDRKYLARVTGLKVAAGGQIEFSAPAYTANEGQGTVTLEVRRTGNTGNAVSVDVATSSANTTAKGGDFVQKSETLNFASGETKKTFVVTIRQDTEVEDDETFNVLLSNPTGDAEIGIESAAQVRIVSDDNSTAVGSVDTAFGNGVIGPTISAININSEGKIVVAGDFRAINGQSRLNIARLEESGVPDVNFRSSAWTDAPVFAAVTQEDGKVLLGGSFSLVSGNARRFVARLNANGSFDPGFDPGTGPNGVVYSLLTLPFGDSLVGGAFSGFNGAPSSGYLVKLFTDGTIDGTFNPQVNGTVISIAQQRDGKFLIGGDFTQVGGLLRNRIARLNTDGSLDRGFDPGAGADGSVRTIALQADGGIIIGGGFGTVNGGPWRYLARLLSTGLPDPSFNSTIPSTVYATAVQADGRILAGGDFVGGLARLTANGSPDPTLAEAGAIADAAVYAIGQQADGRIVAGGIFKKFNKFPRSGLARLQGTSVAPGGEFEFSSPTYLVSESQAGVALEVRRTGTIAQSASVDVATVTGNSATAGDFNTLATTLNFAPGETRKNISVTIRQDSQFEEDESFSLALSNPSAGADLGAVRTAQVLIRDDDPIIAAGALDTSFRGNATASAIQTLSVLPDGKILAGGDFRVISGGSRVNFTRLLPDGQLDESFYPALWFDGAVYTSLVQEDERIVVGGAFSSVAGKPRRFLARINKNGTVDETFNPGLSANSYIYCIAPLANGDLLAAGSFSQFNGDSKRVGLVKLFGDGSLDTSFNPQINSAVYSLALQSDGKILIGGEFTLVEGQVRNRIARLKSDGTIDPEFDPGIGADGSVRTVKLLPDNKIVLGGAFGTVGGVGQRYVARLNSNGLPDLSFTPDLNGTVYSMALQLDGKILVGGDFNGRVARLRKNGTLDPSGFGGTPGPNASVYTIALQPDGNVLAGGNFTKFGELNRSYLIRLQGLSDTAGGELEFGAAAIEVPESQGNVVVEVRRSGNTDAAVTVDYATVSGSATAQDYSPQTSTLVFGSGESRKTINVAIRSDSEPEDTESFTLVLSNPTGGAILGAERGIEVRILNDDLFTKPGAVDLSWRAGATLGSTVNALANSQDGKVIVGGDFRSVLGQPAFNLTRLSPDGTVDETFDSAVFFDGPVYSVAVQGDGKLLVGGAFGTVDGVTRRFLARLTANGTVDGSFNPGASGNSYVYALYALTGGEVLAGGSFTAYNGDSAGIGLVKILTDGTRDGTYNPRLNGAVYAITGQSDGKVLIGGDFTSADGQTRNRIARLNADGTLDRNFNPSSGADGAVRAIAVQADGKILIGGGFGTINGISRLYLARLNTDGTLDNDYAPGPNGVVFTIQVDGGGNAHAGGSFSALGGSTQAYYAKLRLDGSIHPDSKESAPMNNGVNAILIDTSGRIILGGFFTQVANLNRSLLVRLNGSNEAGPFRFTKLQYSPAAIQIYGTGGSPGAATLETSADLKTWNSLGNGNLTGGEIKFDDSTPATRRFYRLKRP